MEAATPLARLLARRIALAGPLTVADFMAEALGHPEHGYYRQGERLGAAGDFVTAPEISQMFGELIGLWLVDQWTRLGEPAAVRLAELGPGRGTLMADALRAARLRPAFLAALSLHLVESSRSLRAEQAARLAGLLPEGAAPAWHESLAEIPADGPLLLVANEFFDALPVHQLVRAGGGWRERGVGLDAEGRLCFALLPAGPAAALLPPAAAAAAPEGAVLELCPAGLALAAAVARRVVGAGGAALIVDYGHAGGFGDTLQAVRRHRRVSPLDAPGETDLTAHVDFAALAAAARSAGAAVFGPVGQGPLLLGLGLQQRAATLTARGNPAQRAAIEAAGRRLCDPGEMGTLFKALAIAAPGAAAPAGFAPPELAAGGLGTE
ncbi:MAG: SAM-dependent methyltransferase [Dongiaceae bacterium]